MSEVETEEPQVENDVEQEDEQQDEVMPNYVENFVDNVIDGNNSTAREDFDKRDDVNWLVHSLVWIDDNMKVKFGTRPVNMNTLTSDVQSIPLQERIY